VYVISMPYLYCIRTSQGNTTESKPKTPGKKAALRITPRCNKSEYSFYKESQMCL